MRIIHKAIIAIGAISLAACAGTGSSQHAVTEAAPATDHKAVLFVSLEDGSVVRQEIDSAADYCFKANASTETTCLTVGAPIIDPATDEVIAYQMTEQQLQLRAAN